MKHKPLGLFGAGIAMLVGGLITGIPVLIAAASLLVLFSPILYFREKSDAKKLKKALGE